MSDHVLLSCQQMYKIAQQITHTDDRITLGEIRWNRFNDTFPNIFIKNIDSLMGKHVSFLAYFSKAENVFEQLSVMYALAEFRPKSFRILLPYFPTGTMERIDNEGQVATAATLAQAISAIAPAGPGPVPLFIWDIHALPIRHYFGTSITPRFKTGTKLLKERLRDMDVAIAFPDRGSKTRFRTMFAERDKKRFYDFILCSKERNGDERIVRVVEGDPTGRHVVIVEDLVHSGGTLVRTAEALFEAGATGVSAYATHGVMEEGAWKKFVDAGFSHVWITDSCPLTVDAVKDQPPFEVLSLVPSMIEAIFDL